ncbi:MAG: undecaprenyl/decaprenyl-phosphate alpha-N-acetylglucosaminyl 1-phosphate transferase [Candidatus Schekmanbacteria bacterium]|nr:undecaprenyl/decaprenyl-phosphate alpha-N-acetylglucosaminyl 1-phosphate transferase [Candidatus Schekmanbacteria bacterium]
MVLYFLLTFVLSFLLSIYGTPVAMKAATKFGIIDKPDGKLKTQGKPVPYLGGLSVYLSFLLSIGMTLGFSREVLGMVLSGTIVLLLGLIDDLGALSPGVKFIGQLIAIFVLIKSGVMISVVILPYWLCVLFTILWIVGITNGFNLIDIMDGLSAGTAFFASIFFFIISIINNNLSTATISAALAGSLLGFLYFNFEPARIYLGDTGSMFIGLTLGTLAMTGKYSTHNQVGFLAPLIALGVPIFDTFLVSYIRALRRRSIFIGSRDHFAIRLRHWALSVKSTVLLSYGVAVILGIIGILITYTDNMTSLSIVSVILLAFILITYWLKKIDVEN